jgi:phosphate/phosphite/phosphonate ABC transporter binding protein
MARAGVTTGTSPSTFAAAGTDRPRAAAPLLGDATLVIVGRGSFGFGIVRSVEPSQGRARLAELCSILSDDLGTIFIPHHPVSYGALADQCERGDLAVAWMPPLATARLEATGKVSILALPVRRGAVSYRAALITRRDGPATLAELQGSSIGWVDRESCSGYVMPRLFMASLSLEVRRLFSRETFLGSHAAVVDAVIQKRVQVGATYCSVDGRPGGRPSDAQTKPRASTVPPPRAESPSTAGALTSLDGTSAGPLRLLAASAPIPNDALVVSAELPIDMRSKLLRWFLDLKNERARKLCFDLLGAGGFRVAAPEHFAALHQMVRAARAHGEVA